MKIININKVSAEKRVNILMKTLFDEDVTQKERLVIGTARIPPGIRVPAEGESDHDGDEYAIILKGRSSIVSGGQEYQVFEGTASFIPSGEAHWSVNDGDTDCELLWMLVKP